MAAKILAVAQQKGGAGKTTIAVQLGVWWASKGRKVTLLDVDPQGSMNAWHGLRAEAGIDGAPYASEVAGWKLSGEIDRLKRENDLIIVDTPPHAETDARVAVRAAELILVPVQPSPMDWWATKPTLDMAAKEKTRCLLILNRLPARGKLALEIVRERLKLTGVASNELRFELVGVDSLHGAEVSGRANEPYNEPYEVRLRVAGRTENLREAVRIGNEVETLYTNGPAAGGGAWKSARDVVAVASVLLPRELAKPQIRFVGA